MSDVVDLCNYQLQKMSDDIHRRVHTAPANSVHDCIECDREIGIARKSAVPWATRCIKCQSAHEAQRRRY